jgi:two-component system cell cycle sensor histidine kinase/response regulator CckA
MKPMRASHPIDEEISPMKTPIRILHVDTNPQDSDVVRSVLEAEGLECTITRVESLGGFVGALKRHRYDIIISDYSLPSLNGSAALTVAKKEFPHIPFIFFTDDLGDSVAIECMKDGARDFVVKKNVTLLALVVGRVLHEAEDRLERQRAEEAMKASREYAQSIIDSSLDMIVAVDVNRRIIEFNKAAERTFGYTRDEVIGSHVDILYARPRQGLRVHKTTILNGRCVEEITNKRKNGELFPTLLSASILRNSHGELTGVMGVSRDITEEKGAEDRLREQAALLDVAQDAIFTHDLNGRIVYWNKSAERILGWAAGEMIGRNVDDELFASIRLEVEEHRRECLKTGNWRGEIRHKTKDGKDVILESKWTLVRDSHENPKSILVVNTDVSEKKKLELQLLRTQRMESIGTLAGGIAHDLNNVLTPILGGLQILRRKMADEQSQRLLSTLETSAKRGTDIVKQVLTFARGVEGERVVLQPRHLVREVEKIIRETFPKSIQLIHNITKDLWTISGDATQLHQVLLNLCVNARDAMLNGGTLTLSAENVQLDENYARMNVEAHSGPYVVISVSDTGTGIPPDIMNKIFDPFFTTKEVGKGTGLGLATVQALVKGHNGFVNVYSEVGRGTTFKTYFPAADAEAVLQHEDEERLDIFQGNGELILIVDDEDCILEITNETLSSYGYRVISAHDGTEAVAAVAANRGSIDIVVTDMMMPFMDGPSTIRALRKIDPSIKIIASSGLGNDGRIAELQGLGVEGYLTKPYTADKLLAVVQDVVKIKSGADRQSLPAPPPIREKVSDSFVSEAGVAKVARNRSNQRTTKSNIRAT